jgi:hypothetical protein
VVANLEKVTPELLCKMEKIFPPDLFLSMQHLIVHLPYEAHIGGPCRPVGAIQSIDVGRPFTKKIRNKAKIEAFIAEASILEEVTNFT